MTTTEIPEGPETEAESFVPHPAFPDGCGWLVEVRSFDPDGVPFVEVVECGAPVFVLISGDPEDGWECEAGHHHFTYGSARQRDEEFGEWMAERAEAARGYVDGWS